MSDAPDGANQPRGVVKVEGEAVEWVHWETEETTFTGPSTFSVTMAISDLTGSKGLDYYASAADLGIEIFAGRPSDATNFSASDLRSIFAGKCDDATADFEAMTLTLTGRDLSAPLIDTKTSDKYTNQTASQVAETLAAKYDLTPVVTATTEKVGKFYQIDHVDLKEERTEWDLLTWVARESGSRVYVRGRELHFEPIPAGDSGTVFALTRAPGSGTRTQSGNYVGLKCSRTLTVAGDIEVEVKSWNSKKKKAFTATAKRTGKATGLQRGGGQKRKQKYSYSIPNLSPDQAQQRANQILSELSKHAMKIGFSGPGVDDLHVTDCIKLSGTGTVWDQTYHPDSIHRQESVEDGYEWTVEAKNQSTTNEPTL